MPVKNELIQDRDERDIFVVSDLHIGDGSAKDNLLKSGNQALLYRFLDEVDRCRGRLIILGDLFELWRYSPQAVVNRWAQLLDRFSEMDVSYVPGNHDWQFWQERDYWQRQHPFFARMRKPFVTGIGDKYFKFMHGHEIDPMISETMGCLRPALRLLTGVLEFRSTTCLVTSDGLTDVLLEAGEQILHLWKRLTRQFNRAIYEPLGLDNSYRAMIRPIRTRNMMARFYHQQQQGAYDITITGHTHQAGHFGGWYFNCGCWTQSVVNYMRIHPDGTIEVFDRKADGEYRNQSVVLR